jgi:ubiquinone/menaquinone biosynthesis C-methylase UbiE
MNHTEAGKYWNENAHAWTQLARAGYDTYRDNLNTPAFFAMLPEVRGRAGLDIGCGEGHNTRLLAQRGARVTAVDIAENFIGYAREAEEREPLRIEYRVASAVALPFADASFDFAIATMSFMDVPEYDRALAEACRVIKPGGFFQFSIGHPCTDTPHRKNVRDETGTTRGLELGGYFGGQQQRIMEWLFGATPKELKQALPKFKTPCFHHTLSEWLNTMIATGFAIERVEEPTASDEVVARCRHLQDAQVMPYFLHIRGRKGSK